MNETHTFYYDKELYPKVAVIKTAYHFTDCAYIHLDSDKDNYIVTITPKSGCSLEHQDFDNEVLAQTARYVIFQQTKELRKITLARAMASSIVEINPKDSTYKEISLPADDILKSWFDS
ncbi:His-Xaa-Ser system protein HxsD [Lachnoclostridium sp. Marseille-P6806]|uniref:His-Xaa-Ser system protein HxsD n=1 Tax=Lachnoclostridium sp. Marseille-P6806 TaxID=2364793 RepID=UPI0010317757|nr:His-Xaa-Ser system protein HxsD [Lachnoclostridium sp. Marseille-P6806]